MKPFSVLSVMLLLLACQEQKLSQKEKALEASARWNLSSRCQHLECGETITRSYFISGST
jgi:hypothetical protein